jgi:hypothetical protein
MSISHIGHSIVYNPIQNFHVRNVLHVPTASKNLLFVHRGDLGLMIAKPCQLTSGGHFASYIS